MTEEQIHEMLKDIGWVKMQHPVTGEDRFCPSLECQALIAKRGFAADIAVKLQEIIEPVLVEEDRFRD